MWCWSGKRGILRQELSYRKQIARKLRTQHVDGIYDNPVTLKSRLRVIQGHWKRNHWVDHTRLTISRVIWRWIISWPKIWLRDHSRLLKLVPFENGCGFLSAFYSNHGRICSRLWDIQCQKWHDLENQVRGRSTSLKMALFDRPCNFLLVGNGKLARANLVPFSSYWRWIISWPWKSGLEVTQGHWNWSHSKAWVRFLIRLPY